MNPILVSALTTLITAALGGIAVKVGWDAATTAQVAGALAAGAVAIGVAIWKALQHSRVAVIAAAAKAIEPDGGMIQTTAEIANGPLAEVPNVVAKKE